MDSLRAIETIDCKIDEQTSITYGIPPKPDFLQKVIDKVEEEKYIREKDIEQFKSGKGILLVYKGNEVYFSSHNLMKSYEYSSFDEQTGTISLRIAFSQYDIRRELLVTPGWRVLYREISEETLVSVGCSDLTIYNGTKGALKNKLDGWSDEFWNKIN
ncbi:hypothetical protein AGMMS49938_06530 [Fibrobacterales bacterium]|nr:hypothetical protein AGMMS49938_06530 [Fibrobacterales bacterium]